MLSYVTCSTCCYVVAVQEPGRADEAASAQAFQVTLLLRLPRDYPDVVPDIELLGLDGIFNERRVQRVIDELRAVAEGNLGMPMGFTIVSALQVCGILHILTGV